MDGEQNPIKYRTITFCDLHPDPNQAQTAMLLLSDIEGVEHLHINDNGELLVGYDLRFLTLAVIEDALTELGFHLDSSLLYKLKSALYHYTEEAQRANLGLDRRCAHCRQVFINRYQRLQHGCRDERPRHWRKYL